MAGTTEKEGRNQNTQLEAGTYELIQRRLRTQTEELRTRLNDLNIKRKEVFGNVDFQLIATDRINTENNCIPRDMVALGNQFIFGYNVHMGLKTTVQVSDVFSYYSFSNEDHSFQKLDKEILKDPQFREDFQNLYKYYKDTVFAKFAVIGPNLFMVFRVGKSADDIKTFKWAVKEEKITYLGNRFDHELKYPSQHQFSWKRTSRDMQRRGEHPHVSIMDRVFVETIGGDLTIKVEDNTDSGYGIYAEPVDHPDQTLDDAEYHYADLGNIILLRIKPYQEKAYRYLIFNQKIQEVIRVDALEEACILLPDDQGIVFSNGYYLQTGEYKLFDKVMPELKFEKRISSTNGEDFLYTFYNMERGVYVLLPYNLVQQKVDNLIICNGVSIFPNGELCYFKAEDQPGRHHVVQIWQTPYGTALTAPSEFADTWLYKIGNKDLVQGMAECNELLVLLSKEDSYNNLYIDLVKKASDILDSYYWIAREEAMDLASPLSDIKQTAASAIDEYEKVRRVKQNTQKAIELVDEKTTGLMDKIRRYKPKDIDTFVQYLAELRSLRGELIGAKDLRYADISRIEALEAEVIKSNEKISQQTVDFLVNPEALSPYQKKVDESKGSVSEISKVAEATKVEKHIDGISQDLELLIDIVSNLQIEDTTQTTRIIDNVSQIYAQLNALRATLKKRKKELRGSEAGEEFQAQSKLLSQGMINYLELCDTPQKCDEYLGKIMIQLEELEGKFADYENFILQLTDKREEIYNAFETRKLGLLEARNKRSQALMNSADRILKGIQNRISNFKEVNEINSYFASDIMIEKVRGIISQLGEMEDPVKAGDIQSRLKTIQEDGIRQLKDKKDLFVDGANIIRLGRHAFSVTTQSLDLTAMPKNGDMYFHLSGTSFFEKIEDEEFNKTRPVWSMTLPSENQKVYRAEFLVFKLLEAGVDTSLEAVQEFMKTRFSEGYSKGIHDHDAFEIYQAIKQIEQDSGLLKYTPSARACARFFWELYLEKEERESWLKRIKAAWTVKKAFPNSQKFNALIEKIESDMRLKESLLHIFNTELIHEAAQYLFDQLGQEDHFVIEEKAGTLYKEFTDYLHKKQLEFGFKHSLQDLDGLPEDQYDLSSHWFRSYFEENHKGELSAGLSDEVVGLILSEDYDSKYVKAVQLVQDLAGLLGEHSVIQEGNYQLDYHRFKSRLQEFNEQVLPEFVKFTEMKKSLTQSFKEELKLNEFKPRVLTSFVRNQLIDKVYLPLIGDNLAKQLGTAGENTRTDRQGLLLLISPPGYGKTTLMEYVANRLGLIFMKINGPAIGHHVTSLDPSEAPNAAAREELEKLNLSLEMGDNVMIYLDDIQHCNPEFLQKYISLCDAQRKIEGVYKGKTRTYDLRGKKVAVVMAGNPYTESGEKFQIPDMLANRADTYNLGDILGGSEEMFKLSYLENSLTANPVLHRLSTRSQKDILNLIKIAETGSREGIDFETHFSPEEIQEYVGVLEKLLKIRDVILAVNQEYIASAAQQDEFRIEPPFKLQGSYRNMNRLAEKVQPLMNEDELRTLILSHYESEAQTLTNGAEANLLKFKMLNAFAEKEDEARWNEIKEMFMQQKNLSADRLAQLVQEMGAFTSGLNAIKDVLEKGMKNGNGKV
ncbi:MAG: DNA repair ATPase [Bacteroidia bacterium]|nr:DNA repair ATPase [Bacteroidia bacterium]